MKHSLDYNEEDEAGFADDDMQQDNETATKGAYHIKKKHSRTADHDAGTADPLDADLLPVPEQEDDHEERETKPTVAPKTAKQQMKEKLAAAQANFGKLPKLPKEPANDNFKPVVSWPLMDQLTRNFERPGLVNLAFRRTRSRKYSRRCYRVSQGHWHDSRGRC
jgi:hypothetical protein